MEVRVDDDGSRPEDCGVPTLAIVMLAHGSPDPAWSGPAKAAVRALRERVGTVPVRLAVLTGEPAIEPTIDALVSAGHSTIAVLPLLLSGGGRHLTEDIPACVEALRARHPSVRFESPPRALGDDPAVAAALAEAAERALVRLGL